jgi:hypothetical protein
MTGLVDILGNFEEFRHNFDDDWIEDDIKWLTPVESSKQLI